jgi:hypothetical protein
VIVEDIDQALIGSCVSPSLRYACLYWAQHVEQSHNSQTLQYPINYFMHEHFLHWLEVLSLVDKLSEGVDMVALLGDLFVSLLLLTHQREALTNQCLSTMASRPCLR